MALPVALFEKKPGITVPNPMQLTGDRSTTDSLEELGILLKKAHGLMMAGEEADNQSCWDIARQEINANAPAAATQVKEEILQEIAGRYPDVEDLPKAPNQKTHPAMDSDERANFQDKFRSVIDASRDALLETILSDDPLKSIGDRPLVGEGFLANSIGHAKKDLREKAANHVEVLAKLDPSLSQEGRIRRLASPIMRRFQRNTSALVVEVKNGGKENLRAVFLDLIETLETIRDPDMLGRSTASAYMLTNGLHGTIRKHLSAQYNTLEEQALAQLRADLTKLDNEVREHVKSLRVSRLETRGSRTVKAAGEIATANAQEPDRVNSQSTGNTQVGLEPKDRASGPKVVLPSDLRPKQIIAALKRMGLKEVPGGGKGDHQKILNTKTNMSANIYPGMSRTVLMDRLEEELGVDPKDFLANLRRRRKLRTRGRL